MGTVFMVIWHLMITSEFPGSEKTLFRTHT